MKTLTAIVVCASLAMPLFAYAQAPADVAYCNQLRQTYRSTVMSNSTLDATVLLAMPACYCSLRSYPDVGKGSDGRKGHLAEAQLVFRPGRVSRAPATLRGGGRLRFGHRNPDGIGLDLTFT